jgi:hypothetical protein
MIFFKVWKRFKKIKGVQKIVLFFKTTTSDQYDVSRLMLSPIVAQPAVLQLQNNNTEFVWWCGVGWGGWLPTHYHVTPNSN